MGKGGAAERGERRRFVKQKRRRELSEARDDDGRGDRIRTCGLLVPNQTRYQTALHLGAGANKGTRTLDLRFTKPLLYQLSYIGALASDIITNERLFV
jgi:hypothetical protein